MAPPTHQDQLSAYLDGELEDAEAASLEAELRANPSLRSELEELREVASFLRTQGPARAPAGFHARVMAAVEAERPTRSWWAWLRRPFGVPIEGLAVAAAAAAVLLLAIPNAPEPAPEAAPEPAAQQAGAPPVAAVESEAAEAAEPPKTPKSDDAVAVVDEEIDQELRKGSKDDLRSAKEPLPSPITEPTVESKEAPTLGATSTLGTKAGTAEADDAKALGRTAGWRYEVYADDPGVLGELQRIAGRYEGAVNDMNGAAVAGTRQSADEAVYAIRIPAKSLQSFHREIERIGVQVTPAGDNRIFGDAFVDVAVTVRLVSPVEAAPASDEAYQRP